MDIRNQIIREAYTEIIGLGLPIDVEVNAIRIIVNPWSDETVISAEVEKHRKDQKSESAVITQLKTLTPCEFAVMDALTAGKCIKEIAFERDVRPQTIWKHRISIFKKLQVNSVVELIRLLESK